MAAGQVDDGAPSDADAELFRTLLRLWGAGNLVLVFVVLSALTGGWAAFFMTLATIASITGYSLKDLLELVADQDSDE